MTNAFIYAQGKGSRWGEGSCLSVPSVKKQLIPIGNELLIQRTVRQFSSCNNITLFGCYDVYCGLLPEHVNVYELKEPTGSIIDGLCSTWKYWNDDETSLILLGDVFFSSDLVRDLLSFSGSRPTFFGRMSENMFTGKLAKEIFAIAIPSNIKEQFHGVLIRFVNKFNTDRNVKKLWDLVRFIRSDDTMIQHSFRDYSAISYADDCDSPDEWREFGKKLVSLAMYDDKMNNVLA